MRCDAGSLWAPNVLHSPVRLIQYRVAELGFYLSLTDSLHELLNAWVSRNCMKIFFAARVRNRFTEFRQTTGNVSARIVK